MIYFTATLCPFSNVPENNQVVELSPNEYLLDAHALPNTVVHIACKKGFVREDNTSPIIPTTCTKSGTFEFYPELSVGCLLVVSEMIYNTCDWFPVCFSVKALYRLQVVL